MNGIFPFVILKTLSSRISRVKSAAVLSLQTPTGIKVGAADVVLNYSSTNNADTVDIQSLALETATVYKANGVWKVHAVAAGNAPISLNQPASGNYLAAEELIVEIAVAEADVDVPPVKPVITFPQPANPRIGGSDVLLGASSTNTNVPITYTVNGDDASIVDAAKLHLLTAEEDDEIAVTASQVASAGYSVPDPVTRTVTVLAESASVEIPIDTPEIEAGEPIGIMSDWTGGSIENHELASNFSYAGNKITTTPNTNGQFAWNHYTAADRWMIDTDYKLVSIPSFTGDTNKGLLTGISSVNPVYNFSIYSYLLLDASIFGADTYPVVIWSTDNNLKFQSETGISAIAGDTFRHNFWKNKGKFVAAVTNNRTGEVCVAYAEFEYKFDRPLVIHNTGKYAIKNTGTGTFEITSFKVSSLVLKGKPAGVGNSLENGLFAEAEQARWIRRLGCQVQAGGGDTSKQMNQRIPELINYYQPTHVFYMPGANPDEEEPGKTVLQVLKANMLAFKSAMQVAGITVYPCCPPAQNLRDMGPVRDVFIEVWGAGNFADMYEATKEPSSIRIRAEIDAGEGVHFNSWGNDDMFVTASNKFLGTNYGKWNYYSGPYNRQLVREDVWNPTLYEAIRIYVQGLVDNNLQNKLPAIFLPVSSSVAYNFNLMKPIDIAPDNTWRLTRHGQLIFNKGVKGDGVSAYLDTNMSLIGGIGLDPYESGWAVYALNPTPNIGGYEIGASAGGFFGLSLNYSETKSALGIGTKVEIDKPSDLTGLFSIRKVNSTLAKLYRNGVEIADVPGDVTFATNNITLLSLNGTSGFSDNKLAFAALKTQFTADNESVFYSLTIDLLTAMETI